MGVHARGGSQWQSRRNMSFGPPVRRAHPASGATWNVQIVRGKMTSKCLWHACRALGLGILLMLIGAGMATIGYYAEDLSIFQEIRGNATVRVKNEARGFHLNNLSYAGPIVMGVGGFIVVAACVMTFEARDSAAKVVPARFKISTSTRSNATRTNSCSRRSNATTGTSHAVGSQTNRWDHHIGVFKTSSTDASPQDRQALTAALIHFSKGSPKSQLKMNASVPRSGSVPNLKIEHQFTNMLSNPTTPIHKHSTKYRKVKTNIINSNAIVEKSNALLHPGMLKFQRHTLSVDETVQFNPYRKSNDSSYGSDCSMYLLDGRNKVTHGTTLMSHSENPRIKERTRRSDTAKKHVLSRQKPIERDELHSPKRGTSTRRKSGTNPDVSHLFRRTQNTNTAISSPTSDSNQLETLKNMSKTFKSPKQKVPFMLPPSSDSERDKSAITICPEHTLTHQSYKTQQLIQEECLNDVRGTTETKMDDHTSIKANIKRPNTLILNCNLESTSDKHRHLTRSNSSRMANKTLTNPKINLSSELDEIYFISRNKDDENYDSIEVIDERRNKNFRQSVAPNSHCDQHTSDKNISSNVNNTNINNTNNVHNHKQQNNIVR